MRNLKTNVDSRRPVMRVVRGTGCAWRSNASSSGLSWPKTTFWLGECLVSGNLLLDDRVSMLNDPNPYTSPSVTIESDSTATRPSPRLVVIALRWTVAAVLVAACAAGLLIMRHRIPLSYRAVPVLIWVFCHAAFPVALLLRVWRFPFGAKITAYQIAVICSWITDAMAFQLAGKLDGDLLGVVVSWWLITAIIGLIVLCMPNVICFGRSRMIAWFAASIVREHADARETSAQSVLNGKSTPRSP